MITRLLSWGLSPTNSERVVGKPYPGITSCLPVIRPEWELGNAQRIVGQAPANLASYWLPPTPRASITTSRIALRMTACGIEPWLAFGTTIWRPCVESPTSFGCIS